MKEYIISRHFVPYLSKVYRNQYTSFPYPHSWRKIGRKKDKIASFEMTRKVAYLDQSKYMKGAVSVRECVWMLVTL